MKTEWSLFFVLMVLLASCGCIDTRGGDDVQNGTTDELPVNGFLTPAPVNTGVSIDLPEVEVRGGPDFSPNITLIASILQNDLRTRLLIENGWNITSITEPLQSWGTVDPARLDPADVTSIDEINEKKIRAQGSAAVEFQKEGLSFIIGVDEQEERTAGAYCGAEVWTGGSASGPRPKDYHQARDKMEGWWHVFDNRNERMVMIYNSTTIFYLYPSYAIIDMEGILD